ncbi:6-phosphogluconolactonase [Arthrobacter sp. AL08]|uniref:6-phosphogluconolactonase n=1 Tax=Micrococcaceae TaxID=1268 RepID=UPI001D0013DE|nr:MULTISPECIES: 6-phosphogluconolactonase [Micrococcaceae]MCB5282275.1 6-phosphogluconolactonase [Arthrobacter sp. ES1]MDI3241845.1 6-phosphogluconolactonase [Arthrobacter sp. AL05]MDI3277831.1 6-phosphogluconolactonase [Arthrobacter sp. AL08]MDJ0351795.1 6-phosphogluconolactonase [Pseudarthrobacter sp. PH31-O2]WGZ81075.1 6-phosphogluconolactonase [Arthrobacter sp. EM1]
MSAEPRVSIHPDSTVLMAAIAARLITKLVDIQDKHGEATVVLTGGSMGIGSLKAVAESPAAPAVDWSKVNFWWGDERFLAAEDPERNARQARDALLSHINADPERIHTPGSTADFDTPEEAAADYSRRLAAAAAAEHAADMSDDRPERPGVLPRFDIVLLGVGPDAHVASLFPEQAGVREKQLTVVGVRNSPKPPPMRVSLTLPAINTALEIWMVVAGEDKAGAVGLALAGANPVQVPAAGPRGRDETLWLIDENAASHVPEQLVRKA